MNRIALILVIMSSVFFGCIDFEKRRLYDAAVGTYKVNYDFSDSNITVHEKHYYRNTKLILEEDGTYRFTHCTPNSMNTFGEWDVIGDEIERRIRFSFRQGFCDTDICIGPNCVIHISLTKYTDNLPDGYRNLAFQKI